MRVVFYAFGNESASCTTSHLVREYTLLMSSRLTYGQWCSLCRYSQGAAVGLFAAKPAHHPRPDRLERTHDDSRSDRLIIYYFRCFPKVFRVRSRSVFLIARAGFAGGIPPWLGGMTSLEEVDLSATQLGGERAGAESDREGGKAENWSLACLACR